MQVTVNLKEILILILIVALIALVIYAIIMIANLIKTLKMVNPVLDDVKKITGVVAKKSEQIDGLLDEVNDVAFEIARITKGNMSTIEKLKGIGAGAASVKGIVNSFRRSDYEKKGRAKRNKKSKHRK